MRAIGNRALAEPAGKWAVTSRELHHQLHDPESRQLQHRIDDSGRKRAHDCAWWRNARGAWFGQSVDTVRDRYLVSRHFLGDVYQGVFVDAGHCGPATRWHGWRF